MDRIECFRILDLPVGASQEEIRTAWRELNKVWHPDRFGSDEALRRKAEEKLKAINQAYELLQKNGSGTGRRRAEPQADESRRAGWAVRDERHEVRADSLEQIARWVVRGKVVASDEVWDPRRGGWIRVSSMPELARLIRIRTLQKWTRFALFSGMLGFLLLMRRPVGLNAAIGLGLVGFAFVMMWIYRQNVR